MRISDWSSDVCSSDLRAGYSERTAEVQASRLLSNANVAEAVQAEMDKSSRRTAITADYVLDVIKGTIESCQSGADYNPGAVLKGAELLGRHLRLFASFAPNTR